MTEPWRHRAACNGKDTNWWFPPQSGISTVMTPAARRAVAICQSCPVAAACLEQAMNKPEHYGIWGGLTAEQRRGMRRRKVAEIMHGTKAGYTQHLRWGEIACDDCKRAHAEYTAALRRIRKRAQTRDDIDIEGAI